MAVLVFSLWRAWSDQCARRPGVAFYIKAGISSWWLRDQENPWGGVWSRYTLASLSASSIPSRIQWPLFPTFVHSFASVSFLHLHAHTSFDL